jgi:2-methylcitrate dehydratase PrpD
VSDALGAIAAFTATAEPPPAARVRAGVAVMDTIGVALAGSAEPAARIVLSAIAQSPSGTSTVWGSGGRASAPEAALANGTAAHALDFDDMCFVSLAHPSAPLVPALMSAAEMTGASGRDVLDAYVVGFEIQARLGRLMNPRHYHRGWHCTSTLGVISAAAGASRLLGLDAGATAHALAIAASAASGLKENFGTMVKPLHAGLAARDGVLAAMLAKGGLTASQEALDGPQGYLRALDSESPDLAGVVSDLGFRWEILDTGITVKLYPSCAGTHPSLDAILDLRMRGGFTAGDVESIEIDVDPTVPTILIHDRPTSALEAKFSMPFCAAAAIVFGRVGIETFDADVVRDPRVTSLIPRVAMRVDANIGEGKPALTESRVRIRLRDGREFAQDAHGARGYPARPAGAEELASKFTMCATRVLPQVQAARLTAMLADLARLDDVRRLWTSRA